MKNPKVYYGIIALGVIILAVGALYLAGAIGGSHPARAYAALAVGAVILIAGIVGMFVMKPKGAAK